MAGAENPRNERAPDLPLLDNRSTGTLFVAAVKLALC
jgi:hypothetical protein